MIEVIIVLFVLGIFKVGYEIGYGRGYVRGQSHSRENKFRL
jgi:hypothetical protein